MLFLKDLPLDTYRYDGAGLITSTSGRKNMLQCDLLTLATYAMPFTPIQNEIEFEFTLHPGRTEFKQVRPTWREYLNGRRYGINKSDSYVTGIPTPHLGGYAQMEPLKKCRVCKERLFWRHVWKCPNGHDDPDASIIRTSRSCDDPTCPRCDAR